MNIPDTRAFCFIRHIKNGPPEAGPFPFFRGSYLFKSIRQLFQSAASDCFNLSGIACFGRR